jgi:hypothetical protein
VHHVGFTILISLAIFARLEAETACILIQIWKKSLVAMRVHHQMHVVKIPSTIYIFKGSKSTRYLINPYPAQRGV